MKAILYLVFICQFYFTNICYSQSKNQSIKWFQNAKFGLFIHWGLYAKLGGTYNGKNYYGSGEWIMNQAKIPANEYAKIADTFNPIKFNAQEWAQFAKDIGARYLVVTAKHHEGFSMFDTKYSDFNIVKATPFKRDPMKELSNATRSMGLKFGFYYSQYLDWHESNGGGNDWDFDEKNKNYLQYYSQKSIPQIKELLSNYGPLGLIWFDMPGGLTKEQTKNMIDSLKIYQHSVLFSSRVGQGLGDYKDFGDSEIPSAPLNEPWEAIYTHNDTWGYIDHDMNYKTPKEIIQLLADVVSKGGNLMINIGPDGSGQIPYYSKKFLLDVGKWLNKFGESIYGTTYGLISSQPWGVTTTKPGKLFLHVMQRPYDGILLVPGFDVDIKDVYQLDNHLQIKWKKKGKDILINIPELEDKRNTVFVINYTSKTHTSVPDYQVISNQFPLNSIIGTSGVKYGSSKIDTLTFSHYFGDWKHAYCIAGMKNKNDSTVFKLRFTNPGDYKIYIEYSCPDSCSGQEGVIGLNHQLLYFKTLHTSEYNINEPLLFIKHSIGIVHIGSAGIYNLNIHPLLNNKQSLFELKNILIEPVLE